MDSFFMLASNPAQFWIVAALSVFFFCCQVRLWWCARIDERTGDAVCAFAKGSACSAVTNVPDHIDWRVLYLVQALSLAASWIQVPVRAGRPICRLAGL